MLKVEIVAPEQHLAGIKSPDIGAAAAPSRPVIPSRLDAIGLELKKAITSPDAELKGLHTEESGLVRLIGFYQQRSENMPRTTASSLATTPTIILSPSTDPSMVGTLFHSASLDNIDTYASY
jgi:hypothetical protein